MKTTKVLGLVIILALAVGPGCASKKKPSPGEGTASESSRMGGQELGQGSLDRFKSGQEPSEGNILKDVHFAYNEYDLNEQARSILQQNAEWLQDHPDVRVEIEGHCDERGTVEYNLALGAKRAKSVKDYLAALGISANRLSTISYGEELPLCREATESCWSRNRRAHFVILR